MVRFRVSIIVLLGVLLLLSGAVPTSQLFAAARQPVLSDPSSSQPPAVLAPAAPDDAPIFVLSDSSLVDWTIGGTGGLAYWTSPCYGGEFRYPVSLKRRSIWGGPQRQNNVPQEACLTFRSLIADSDGVYYFNYDGGKLESLPTSWNTDQSAPVVIASVSAVSTRLRLDGNTLYWGANNQVWRVAKTGGTPVAVANTNTGLNDIGVDANYVYWLDSTGLWRENKTCSAPPCSPVHLAAVPGSYLLPVSSQGRVYWWSNSPPAQIWMWGCDVGCTSAPIYTIPSDHSWVFGELVSDGTSIFWTEGYDNGDGINFGGRLKRWNASTSESTLATSPRIRQHLEVVGNDVYFSELSTPPTLYRIPLNATPLVFDFRADGWEVTQAIQNLNNDVPLVANRPTYVRVFGVSEAGAGGGFVTTALYGWRDGVPLPGSPIYPLNGTRKVATSTTYDRGRAESDGYWLFELPYSWATPGTITLQASVNSTSRYPESDLSDNALNGIFTFTAKPPLCIVFVPIRTHAPRVTVQNTPAFWPMVNLVGRLWPTDRVWTYQSRTELEEFHLFFFNAYELKEDDWKIVSDVLALDIRTDDPDRCDNAGAATFYMGMVHADTPNDGGSGMGAMIATAGWSTMPSQQEAMTPPNTTTNWPRAGITVVHELTHNKGHDHVDCPGPSGNHPDDPDENYPYNDCWLSDELGRETYYGFDVNTRQPLHYRDYADYMSYRSWRWVSDYTWKGIFADTLVSQQPRPLVMSQPPAISSFASVALVSGAVTPTLNQGELSYTWILPSAALSQGQQRKWQNLLATPYQATAKGSTGHDHAAGDHEHNQALLAHDYHVRLLAANNSILGDYAVTADGLSRASLVNPFFLTFAPPAGAVARIQLLDGTTLLDERLVSSTAPVVTVTRPTAGEPVNNQVVVNWQGTDANPGDVLVYDVQYSPDQGAHWYTLKTNIPHPSAGNTVSVTLDISNQKSANPAQIRVIASDGYNTSSGLSPNFSVSPRSPEAFIASPSDGSSWAAGEPMTLDGGAMDPEDGDIQNDSISWSVEGQPVGSGNTLTLEGLAPGDYDITLMAQDSNSLTGSDSSTVNVAILNIPLSSGMALDGQCDESGYDAGRALNLRPYPDGTRATARLMRTASHLWACFSGLKRNDSQSNAYVGLWADVNHSRNASTQANDVGFFAGEDGSSFTRVGDGAGGTNVGPSNALSAMSRRNQYDGLTWDAELRITAAAFGGWNHVVGLGLVHVGANLLGEGYHWPYGTVESQPTTWASTALSDHCGDFDGNNTVNVADIQSVAAAWDSRDAFFPYDQDGDTDVDVSDIMKVAGRFGINGC
jgi:hypothetical protein